MIASSRGLRTRVRSALRSLVTSSRRGAIATLGVVVASGVIAVACNEDFVAGPRGAELTLALRNWSDTLVLGEARPVSVLVLDAKGREVLGAKVRVNIVAPAILGTRLDAATTPVASSVDAISSTDGVQFSPLRTGTSQVSVTLADARFAPASLTLKATVVAAGLIVTSARDTTVTSLGDTSIFRASALGRAGVGPSSALVPFAGQDVVWSRLGAGALTLVGGGDLLRTVSRSAGTDTLVVSLPFCLRGARCADTLVVHVVQELQPTIARPDTVRAWSLGDTVPVRGAWLDARGNAIAGVRAVLLPATATDSAIVGVSTATIAGDAAIISRANGIARLVLRAVGPDGRPLGETQIVAVVRQIAKRVLVTPGEADITPGDSVPVRLDANDARGRRIADATFFTTVSNGALRGAHVVVAPGASAGTGKLRAQVTGVAAPSNNPGAPFTDPAPDSASLIVRTPAAKAAGDTTIATANVLTATVLDAARAPRAGVWVRFRTPAGVIVGGDSVQSDAAGMVMKRWLLPTLAGRYTATAVVVDAALQADSAGAIIIRHSSTIVAGALSQLVVVAQGGSSAPLGTPLASEIVVEVRDAYGNPVSQAGIPITVSTGGSGFTLGGTLTVTTDSTGRAHFVDLVGTGAAGPRVLRFTPGGTGGGSAALPIDAAPIDFTGGGGGGGGGPVPQVATNLVVTSGNGQTGAAAQSLSALLVVTVTDGVGAPMAGVPVAFAPQFGSGSAGTPSSVTAVDGTASTTWTLGTLAGPQALVATSSALPAITANFTATAAPGAASLTLSTLTASPTSVSPSGSSILTVQLVDASGNARTTSGGAVALATTAGSLSAVADNANGSYTATLTAPASIGAVTITGTLNGSTLAQSAIVTVTTGAPSAVTSTLSVGATTLAPTQTTSVTVIVRDAANNVIASATSADFVLGATLGTLGTVSCTAGTCTTTFTATTVGSASISATIGGTNIGGSPSTVTITAAPPAPASLAQSTIAASPTALTADGTSTSAITVTLRDAGGVALTASGGTVTLGATGTGTLSGVTDNGNGTYTATLTAPLTPGSAVITASLGGSALTHASNPVTVQFTVGAASLTQSTLAASPTSVGPSGASTITVQLKDAAGNALTSSGGTVALATTGGSLSGVTDNANGTYTATLTAPATPGAVTVSGTLGGSALAQTAVVTVTAGAPSASTSSLAVGATSLAPTQATSVTVIVRDAANNVIASAVPGDLVIAGTLGTLGTVSCAAGTCTTTYTATTSGAAAISAKIGGADIVNSPAAVTITVPVIPPTPVSLTLSTITASPTAVTVGGTSAITVQLRDASSNPIAASGGVVALSATAGSLTSVTDNGNGSYSAILTAPSTPGVVTISGTLDGSAFTSTATVAASVGAPSSIASTLVVTPTSLTVGGTSSVTVVIRDAFGNVLAGAAPSDVVLATTLGTLGSVSCGSGICTATYTGTTAGSASITAKIGGTNIGGSPSTVTITATPASLAQSTIVASPTALTADGTSTSAITVTLRDAGGVALTASGGTVTLGATGTGTLSGVTDNGNGTYTATLTAPLTPGSAVITASLGGSALTHASNPVTVQFTVGAASLTQSTLAASPTSVGPSGASTITVQLKDAAGNALTSSGGTVALATTGGSLSTVVDNANGSYTATLTSPASIGAVTITGTLNGSALAQSAIVTVTTGAPSAATSTLSVGATTLAPAQTTSVTVIVRDAANNVIASATSADFVLGATLGTLGSVSCSAGTCTATYTATTVGAATISAKIGGSDIVNSPAAVTISNSLTTVQAVPVTVLDQDLAYTAFTPVTAAGGTAPLAFALTGGTLPPGMSFSTTTGLVSGTATATLGTTTFTVTVTDAAAAVSFKTFSLTVNSPLVTVQAIPSTTLTVGSAYAPFSPVTASGGTAPLAFALSGGTLPVGVAFSSTNGQVSGTATSPIAATTFTVTVTDAIGAVSSRTFDLAANGPPSAPSISGVGTGDGQLTVTFTAPASDGGSVITNYEYSTDDGTTWTTRAPASTASPLVITGLTNGTTYQVKVRAVNGSGVGTASAPLAGTPATTPTAPSISTVTQGNGQLTVAFAAPASTGGATITNYEYSTDNGTSWTTRGPASIGSPIVITGLTNGTTYQVKLRAVNGVGSGTASSPSSGTPRTVPGAPTSLAAVGGITNAALTWTAPVSDGGSPITDYLVEYSTNGTTWSTFSHPLSTATAITVTGLTNGTTYQFRVSAVNAAGTGLASATAAATPGTPGPPTAVTIAFNQQSATALDGLFSWTAPASNGGSAITDYVIEYKTSSTSSWTIFPHVASTTTSATVPGLLPSTTYNVRISAKNSAGIGAPSAIATATTVGPSSRLSCVQPGTSNSSANSITIAPCAGTTLGDVILIPVTIANASAVTPVAITQDAFTSGFTSLGTQLNGGNQTTIFYKIATAGDVGRVTPYGFVWTGNVKNAISLVAYKATDGAAPLYSSTSGAGVTATSPAVTVSDVSSYTLVYIYTMAGVALSSTTPTVGEWAVSSDLWKNTTAGANNNLAAAITTTDVDKFATGTTSGRAATTPSMTSTTKWNAAVLVLKPAP